MRMRSGLVCVVWGYKDASSAIPAGAALEGGCSNQLCFKTNLFFLVWGEGDGLLVLAPLILSPLNSVSKW